MSQQIQDYYDYISRRPKTLVEYYNVIGSTYDTNQRTKPALSYNDMSLARPANCFDRENKFTKGGFVEFQEPGASDFLYVLTNGKEGRSQFMPPPVPIIPIGDDRYGRKTGG